MTPEQIHGWIAVWILLILIVAIPRDFTREGAFEDLVAWIDDRSGFHSLFTYPPASVFF